MSEPYGWQQLLQHDGYLLVTLEVHGADDGGKDRPVQDGYRDGRWQLVGDEDRFLSSAPLTLVGGRSIEPGEVGEARLHPMAPHLWRDVPIGSRLRLLRGERTWATAIVVDRVNVPDKDVPLKPWIDRRPDTASRRRLRATEVAHTKGRRSLLDRVLRRGSGLPPGPLVD